MLCPFAVYLVMAEVHENEVVVDGKHAREVSADLAREVVVRKVDGEHIVRLLDCVGNHLDRKRRQLCPGKVDLADLKEEGKIGGEKREMVVCLC